MKKADKLRKDAEDTLSKVRAIRRHIRHVEDNCFLLGERLILSGEVDLGRRLIANGCIHDASKFVGIEWENMAPGTNWNEESAKLKLKLAVDHHGKTNPHHPEAWQGIKNMPRLYVGELVCDWKARSEEFGTSLRDYINEQATKRFSFTEEDQVYKEIMGFVDMLCEKPFERLDKK